MQGKDALSPNRPLFEGRRRGQAVWFICSSDGTFGIYCNGESVSVWPAGQLDEALGAFLKMVERLGPAGEFPAIPRPPDRHPAARRLPGAPARAAAHVPLERDRARERTNSAA